MVELNRIFGRYNLFIRSGCLLGASITQYVARSTQKDLKLDN